MIRIEIDDREVRRALEELRRRASNMTQAMHAIGQGLAEGSRGRILDGRDWSVPRVRGDEPALEDTYSLFGFVFPACAGMNRSRPVSRSNRNRVPRVRGDEPPARYGVLVKVQCSPRARG